MNKRKDKDEDIYRINWTFIVVKTGTKPLNYVNQGRKLKEKLIFQSNKKAFIVSNLALVICNVLWTESGGETSEACDLFHNISLQAGFIPQIEVVTDS